MRKFKRIFLFEHFKFEGILLWQLSDWHYFLSPFANRFNFKHKFLSKELILIVDNDIVVDDYFYTYPVLLAMSFPSYRLMLFFYAHFIFLLFSENFQNTETMLDDFTAIVQDEYPNDMSGVDKLKTNEEQHHYVLHKLLNGYTIFNQSNTDSLTSNCHLLNQTLSGNLSDSFCPSRYFQYTASCNNVTFHHLEYHEPNKKLVEISHKLHYISVAILAILVLTVSKSM